MGYSLRSTAASLTPPACATRSRSYSAGRRLLSLSPSLSPPASKRAGTVSPHRIGKPAAPSGCGLKPTVHDFRLALRAHGALHVHAAGRRYIVRDVVEHGKQIAWLGRPVNAAGRPTARTLVPLSSQLLADAGTNVDWQRGAFTRVPPPEQHHFATIRAAAIAGVLGPSAMRSPHAHIVTLDTPGRNIEAICQVGWPRERILVVEMDPSHVVYLRLTGRIPPENVIYTPLGWEAHARSDNMDARLRQAVIFYVDYYGSPGTDFHLALERLPALQAYSVCGSVRSVTDSERNKAWRPDQVDAFHRPLAGFARTCLIRDGRMLTNTFVRKEALQSDTSPVRRL